MFLQVVEKIFDMEDPKQSVCVDRKGPILSAPKSVKLRKFMKKNSDLESLVSKLHSENEQLRLQILLEQSELRKAHQELLKMKTAMKIGEQNAFQKLVS